MIITLLLSVMMMAGLFLLLVGGVGYIQDKRQGTRDTDERGQCSYTVRVKFYTCPIGEPIA